MTAAPTTYPTRARTTGAGQAQIDAGTQWDVARQLGERTVRVTRSRRPARECLRRLPAGRTRTAPASCRRSATSPPRLTSSR